MALCMVPHKRVVLRDFVVSRLRRAFAWTICAVMIVLRFAVLRVW